MKVTDPLSGKDVYIVPSRQKRPQNAKKTSCPFCPGGLEAPNDFDTHYFKNRYPAISKDACEVIIYGPKHELDLAYYDIKHIEMVVGLWKERFSKLSEKYKYVLIFENRGSEVGATIEHPHGQIYAFDKIPDVPLLEIKNSLNNGCCLCAGADNSFIVVQTKGAYVISPPWAAYPYELLIYTRDHIPSMLSKRFSSEEFAQALKVSIQGLDSLFGIKMPYMFFIHQLANSEEEQGCHFHAHIAPVLREKGRIRYVGAGELGSGLMFNPVDPRDAAAKLRSSLDRQRQP